MLGSLVAWVALAGGLNYENAGASARRVVEDLARASGARMEAVADFERDIVAVHDALASRKPPPPPQL
jgi:hypothetical protein